MDRANRLAGVASHPARPSRSILVSFFDLVWRWRERARQRRALLALDDRLLSDIGISRAEAEGEACKPFWRP